MISSVNVNTTINKDLNYNPSLVTNVSTIFSEKGLPSGFTWKVSVSDGASGSANTGSTITLLQHEDTSYTYTATKCLTIS